MAQPRFFLNIELVHRMSAKVALRLGLTVWFGGLPCLAVAQTALFDWAIQGGGKGFDQAGGVALDSAGNVVVLGMYQCDLTDWPFAFGDRTVPCGDGTQDLFLAKVDNRGALLWFQQAGDGINGTEPWDLAVDDLGNVAITGNYYNGIRFGTSTFGRWGERHGFVAKYTPAGELLWAGDLDSEVANAFAMATDPEGAIYVGGNFARTNLTYSSLVLTRVGGTGNGFVIKLSSAGLPLWGRVVGGSDSQVEDLAVDRDGSCYIVGTFKDTASFGGISLSGSLHGMFIAKLDPDGDWIWAKKPWLNDAYGFSARIKVDAEGHVLMAGNHSVPPPNFGVIAFTSESDAFVAKYSSEGNPIWATPVACSQEMRVEGISVDAAGHPLVTGLFTGTMTFGPARIVGSSTWDIFAAKCDSDGHPLWTRRTGIRSFSQSNRRAESAFDDAGRCFLTGSFDRPGSTGGIVLTNGFNGDMFVAQMVTPPGILAQPVGAAVPLGGTATFSVTVDGNAPLTYQWLFNGASLFEATNATLVLADVQPAHTGNYSVLVTNRAGAVSSSAATLSISTAVDIQIQGDGAVSKMPSKPFYNLEEQVTLTATPGRWHAFSRWADGPVDNPRVITIGASNTYTALFSPTTAVETLVFDNVSRTAPVGTPAILVDGQFVVAGPLDRLGQVSVTILTTFPNGSIFYALDGSPPSYLSTLYGGPFEVHRTVTLRAIAYDSNFIAAREADPVQIYVTPTHTLDVSTAGGGSVSLVPSSGPYGSNVVVTLFANPEPGWTFLQWLGDASGSVQATNMPMIRDRCVQAVFGTTLSTIVTGPGTVRVDPTVSFFPYGSIARLTAVPDAGHSFAAWGNAVMSTNNPLTFPVTNAAATVSCLFAPLVPGQFALTVVVDGFGKVASTPRGSRFNAGQVVALTALPEPGQEFLGWTGDAFYGPTNLTVTMSQSRVIEAHFTAWPGLWLGPCLGGAHEQGFRIALTGEVGARYWIEYSSDFLQWNRLAEITNTYGAAQFLDHFAWSQPLRTYRLRQIE